MSPSHRYHNEAASYHNDPHATASREVPRMAPPYGHSEAAQSRLSKQQKQVHLKTLRKRRLDQSVVPSLVQEARQLVMN
jgi:hypothetical protein